MKARHHKIYIWTLTLTFLLVFFGLAIYGIDFYLTAIDQRFFHPQYSRLNPSGSYGYLFGVVGTSMIVLGVVIYMLKKRVPQLVHLGPLKHWLEFHIFLCTTGPMLVFFHTSMKVGGLALYSFFGMLCVAVSGITGRFLYGRLPRDSDGLVLSLEELEESIAALTRRLEEYGMGETLQVMTGNYLAVEMKKKRSFPNVLRRIHSDRGFLKTMGSDLGTSAADADAKMIVSIVKSKIVLHRRLYYLKWMQRVFNRWHAFHLPFAAIVISLVLVHVIGTLVLSYYGFFS